MKVLITNGNSILSKSIKIHLAKNNKVILLEDPSKISKSNPDKNIELNHLDSGSKTNEIVNNSDLIIYQALLEANKTPNDLNQHLQKTYNLLSASIESGIPQFIVLSSLKLINLYDDSNTVTETWKSTPHTNVSLLSAHLTEMIFREFTRTFPIKSSILRLGYPIFYEKGNLKNDIITSVTIDEILTAIDRIISLQTSKHWEIYHFQSNIKNQKFLTKKSNKILGVPKDNREPFKETFYSPKLRGSKL